MGFFSKKESKPPVAKKVGRVFRVCLTGGPCSGKTSALTAISKHFDSLGVRTFMVPEAATILLSGGVQYGPHLTSAELEAMEAALMKTQMALEESFSAVADAHVTSKETALKSQNSGNNNNNGNGKPKVECSAVMIMDRGVMDNLAYMSKEMWGSILTGNGWTETELRDNRYDMIIHMVTAADGAEKFYTLSNNAARRETVEQAREIDGKILKAWVGHPKLTVVDNSTPFNDKISRVVGAISELIGVPTPSSLSKSFLLKDFADSDIPVGTVWHDFDTVQYFFKNEDGESVMLRRRFSTKTTISQPSAGEETPKDRAARRKKARALFHEVDQNNDGVVDAEEFHKLCLSLGAQLTLESARVLMEQLDTNRNGAIDFAEFYSWYSASEGIVDKTLASPGLAMLRRNVLAQSDNSSYSISVTSSIDGAIKERPLSRREFIAMLPGAGVPCKRLDKRIVCFLLNNTYFQVKCHHFNQVQPSVEGLVTSPTSSRAKELYLLEVLSDKVAQADLPAFLHVAKEVTSDAAYAAEQLANVPDAA